MENKTKTMLINIMEESAEIIQVCSKSIRFGLTGHHPNKTKTHDHEILTEYYHLQALIEKLQRDKVLPTYSEDHILSIKKDKLRRMKNNDNQSNDKRKKY